MVHMRTPSRTTRHTISSHGLTIFGMTTGVDEGLKGLATGRYGMKGCFLRSFNIWSTGVMIYDTDDAWIRFLIALAMRNTYPILRFEDCFVARDHHAVVLCRSPCLGLVPVAHVSTSV